MNDYRNDIIQQPDCLSFTSLLYNTISIKLYKKSYKKVIHQKWDIQKYKINTPSAESINCLLIICRNV